MANLSFFGSTVDAIAPQEQNVLSQYRLHNWQVEQANAAAAERARQLTMVNFANAQQNEQQQAQQDYVNRVNLMQFADRRESETRQFDANQKYNQDVLGLRRAEVARGLADEKLAEGDEVNAIEFSQQRVAETGSAFDQATKRLETARSAFDTRFNDVQKGLPTGRVKFDRATGGFVSLIGTADPVLNAAIAKANDDLARHTAEYNLAVQEHKNVSDLFQQAQQQLPRGVQVGKQDGKWVINSPTLRKTFSYVPQAIIGPPRPVPAAIAAPAVDLSQFRTGTNAPPIARPQSKQEYDAIPDGTLVQIGGQIVTKQTQQQAAPALIAPRPAAVPFGSTGGATVMDFSNRTNAPVIRVAPGFVAPTVNITPGAGDLVSVFNPTGQPVKIRRSQLADALSKGYRLR